MNTTTAKNGEIRSGDLVVSMFNKNHCNDDYSYLVGIITDIKPLGSPDRETDNETDDVYVNFIAPDYSQKRQKEIEKQFCELYGEYRPFDELPLDSVIMPPDSLIRITGIDPKDLGYLLYSEALVKAFIDHKTSGNRNTAEFSLLEKRLDQNLADCRTRFMKMSKEELINNASEIAAVYATHDYLTAYHHYDNDELAFYLQFQSSLEVVADIVRERSGSYDDMKDIMYTINEREDSLLQQYPLIRDASEAEQSDPAHDNNLKTKCQGKTAAKQKASIEDRLRDAQKKVKTQPINTAVQHNKNGAARV